MDKILSLCGPVAVLIFVVYTIINRFIVKIPNAVAIPVLVVCCALMMVGIAYNGWCWGKGIKAFDCLKK